MILRKNAFVDGNGTSSVVAFDRTLTLDMGDTIDFAVGFGRNGTFFGDSTALAARIQLGPVSEPSPIPEPSTVALFALGLVSCVKGRASHFITH